MFELPWTRSSVPHAVIEVTRDCNLSCRACYRDRTPGLRSVADILDDVRTIERHQRVHTVSLAGGEPTLHPELPAIVRAVKARRHRVSLVTNGLLLTDQLLDELKRAGLDIVMLHVDEGQKRPDLPDASDVAAVNRLREKLAATVDNHGIAVGLCTTLYPDSLENLPELVGLLLRHAHINFLFATHAVVISGLVDDPRPPDGLPAVTTNGMAIASMGRHFGLHPYAFIRATTPTADGEMPCVTYSVPVVHGDSPVYLNMTSGAADRHLVRFSRLLTGRYLYYTPVNAGIAAVQVVLNGVFSGRLGGALRFLRRGRASTLRMKRLVFENAPRLTPDGTVNCCEFCPNSTVRDGKVVPVCLADHIARLQPCR